MRKIQPGQWYKGRRYSTFCKYSDDEACGGVLGNRREVQVLGTVAKIKVSPSSNSQRRVECHQLILP